MFLQVKKLTVQHNTLMASLYQSKENNKNLLEERLSSSLTTQWNRAPYGVQRGTTCSVWCFPIKKQKQTALQGKQPNSLNGIYQQIQGLNKNGRVSTFFLPKSTKQSAWEKHCCIRSGQHLSKMNAQVLSPF